MSGEAYPSEVCTLSPEMSIVVEPVFAKKTVILKSGGYLCAAPPCPQYQCCRMPGQSRLAKMTVFFAIRSTQDHGVANIEIGGAGGCERLPRFGG